jgi:hypothetical protein
MESQWLLWKVMVDMYITAMLLKVNGCHRKSLDAREVIGCYGELVVAMLWKSMVAMESQ